MKTVVLVFKLDEKEYPFLTKTSNEKIEYWIREGYISLGNTYDEVPMEETSFDDPEVIIV